MLNPTLPLAVFVRPRSGIIGIEAVQGIARHLPPSWDRMSLSPIDGGVVVKCVWYGDLDSISEAISKVLGNDLTWSEPQIEYRTEVVENSAGRKREVVLEPLMAVEVRIPPDFVGNVIGDLMSRRGHLVGQTIGEDESFTVAAEVPLAELQGYVASFRTLTNGSGCISVSFKRYGEAPPHRPGPEDPVAAALRVA